MLIISCFSVEYVIHYQFPNRYFLDFHSWAFITIVSEEWSTACMRDKQQLCCWELKAAYLTSTPSWQPNLPGSVFSVTFAKVIETFISAEFLLNTIEEEEEWGRFFFKAQASGWAEFSARGETITGNVWFIRFFPNFIQLRASITVHHC